MHVALRLHGFRRGTIAVSKLGRDAGTVYLVGRIDDPFCDCFDGRKRTWPDRPKKKRIKHLRAIDELPRGARHDATHDGDKRDVRELNAALADYLDRYYIS